MPCHVVFKRANTLEYGIKTYMVKVKSYWMGAGGGGGGGRFTEILDKHMCEYSHNSLPVCQTNSPTVV